MTAYTGQGNSVPIAAIRAAACLVAVLATVVIAAWLLDLGTLQTIGVGTATMKLNTALCFLLSAGALSALTRGLSGHTTALALAGVSAAISATVLAQYLTGTNFGIDELIIEDTRSAADNAPGRMSAITAIEFIILCAAIGAATRQNRTASGIFVASTVGGSALVLLAIVGYAFGTPVLYSPGPATSIAFHTALSFLVLYGALIAFRLDLGIAALLRARSPGGMLARWTLPAILIVTPASGWLILQFELAGYYGAPLGSAMFVITNVVVVVSVLWVASRQIDRINAARRQEHGLNRAIVEGALDAFIVMDSAGRIAAWNPQAVAMFGWSHDEAVGRTVVDTIMPPEHGEAHQRGLARFIATGESRILNRRNELLARRRDGSEFPIELMITPTRMNAGWVFSGFIRDMTVQKQTEAGLRQAQKMEAVGQLTGGIAHDFNNLLSVVIGSLDLAEGAPAAEQRDLIGSALAAAERGAALTHRLLAFSRRQPLSPRAIDLNALIDGMANLLDRTLERSIEIEHRPERDLWRALADEGQVENALLNLAINARDAMPDGGKLTIETGNAFLDEGYAARNAEVIPGPHVMLAVTDTGTGMTPEVIERAFDPFFTTKTHGKGTGLGLSMIYGFAKQSGGHLKIYSEIGSGTTVRLYLPRADEGPPIAAEQQVVPIDVGSGETILLVEDDADVRKLAARILRDLGYSVVEAGDGQEAQAIIEDGSVRIDLLFTDIMMPGGITGSALADYARSHRPLIKTLYTSGYTQSTIVHQNRLRPSDIFLPKPYRRRDLMEKLRQALGPTDQRRG